jgi:hypothetical protein
MTATRRELLEGLTAGAAYGAGLCLFGACSLAVGRPEGLTEPYWLRLPPVRTDTAGIVGGAVLASSLTVSRYLALGRRARAAVDVDRDRAPARLRPGVVSVAATTEVVALLGTALAVYLSLNAVTHPSTLGLPATHLVAWPSESTLRVVAVALASGAVAVLRGYAPVRDLRSSS